MSTADNSCRNVDTDLKLRWSNSLREMASNSGGLRRRGGAGGVKEGDTITISHENSDQDSWDKILSQVRTVFSGVCLVDFFYN